jgi:hypothetical protein
MALITGYMLLWWSKLLRGPLKAAEEESLFVPGMDAKRERCSHCDRID